MSTLPNTKEAATNWKIGPTDAPKPPIKAGLPFLGIAHRMGEDPLQTIVEMYRENGPIFRTKILNREITVLAGLEANTFFNTDGRAVLTSEDFFGEFSAELGSKRLLIAVRGEEHDHLRRVQRRGYSRSAMVPHIDEMLAIVDDYTRGLKPGDTVPVLDALREIVTEQLGAIVVSHRPGGYLPYLQHYLNINLQVHLYRSLPKLVFMLPAYREAKAKSVELGKLVLEEHRNRTPSEEERDLVDDLLAAEDIHGEPYDEDTILASTIGPFFAGIDTVAASLSFLIYNVLSRPELHRAIRAEAESAFPEGEPVSLNALRGMDTLHAASIENLRMYPIQPFSIRSTIEPFEFMGYRVDVGDTLYMAQTVTHYLDEYFPKPYTFDEQRFAKGKGKGVPGAYAPFTLGQHLCLGAGIAEAQIMLNMARLLHNLEIELADPNHKLTIYAAPQPNPGRDLAVRVVANHTR